MIQWILAMIWALACPSHTNTASHNSHQQVTVMDDTGGETGPIPPTGPPHK